MSRATVLCTVLTVLSIPAGLPAQIITGRILEVGTDHPVAQATVTLLAGSRSLLSTESDSAGNFRVAVPRAGWYSLRIERIGYASESSDTLEIGARENVDITLRLSVTAVRLDPLMVIERRHQIRPQSEFERRMDAGRKSGLGVFITRETLDSTSSPSVSGVLARVPFLVGDEFPTSISQGGCVPTLYLNGARFQFATGETIDDLVLPTTLEGIEIYRNRTELPRELAGIGHCGAIVFWTRGGDPGRRAGWRFLAAAGALLGMLALFISN